MMTVGNVIDLVPSASSVNASGGSSAQQGDLGIDFASQLDQAAKTEPKSDGQNGKNGNNDTVESKEPNEPVDVAEEKPKAEEPEPEVIVVLNSIPTMMNEEQAVVAGEEGIEVVDTAAQAGQALPELAGGQDVAENQTLKAFAETLETLEGEGEIPQSLLDKLQVAAEDGQEQTEPASKTESTPVIKIAEDVSTDALKFVKQAMQEAETMLQQQDVDAEPATEAKPLMQGVETGKGEQQESGMTQGDDDGADMGEQKNAAPQPMTANIAQDGKVEFKLSNVQETVEQPVPVKETVGSQIIDQVKTMVSGDKQEIVLQLKPHHLGGLTIMLASEGGGMVAKLITASKEAHNAIQTDMQIMQQELRDKGINVVEIEVIYNQMADSANTQKDSSEGQAWSGGTNRRSHGRIMENAEALTMMYDELSTYDILTEHGGSVEFSA